MHSIGIHKVFDRMMSFFRRIGIWHGEDRPTISQLRRKAFCCIYYAFLLASLLIAAITQGTLDESIFLAEASIIVLVLTVKTWMLLWEQEEIMQLLNRICVFSIRNDDEFAFFNCKVKKFISFVVVFVSSTVVATLGGAIFPFIGNEKTLLLHIAFPLDWRNSEVGFWLAYIFYFTETIVTFLSVPFSALIWYLLLHCSLRYQILGAEIKKMGRISGEVKMSEKAKQTVFCQDLVTSIEDHRHLRGLTDELESFLSKLFLLQFATSAICICCSIYCLAFDISVNFLERLVHVYLLFYNLAELFMITYLGNEIVLSSDGLTYALFESEWIEQLQSTKKSIIIFGEYLRQPHVFIIGKLYPLTLETFTRILKSSYNLFNVLQNIKK